MQKQRPMQPKQAIDNATTNAEVEQAKTAGTASVASVTPTPTAKPAAKQAIDDALKVKNDAIDANNDLTAEEKPKLRKTRKPKPMQLSKQLITRQQTQKWNKLRPQERYQ